MFLDKEEDSVIRLRSLEDEAEAAETTESIQQVYKRFVDFHGEMLLLVHWSTLAYTGKPPGNVIKLPGLCNCTSKHRMHVHVVHICTSGVKLCPVVALLLQLHSLTRGLRCTSTAYWSTVYPKAGQPL